jgi:hypothetical protein
MKIVNLSNPDQEPVNGDFVRYEYKDGTFLEKQYWKQREFTEEEKLEAKKQDEREWRDQELINTDWIVPVVDHPKHSVYMAYRQELRDYPSQPDFPNGKRPIKP